jgi:hypothetical protein
MATYIDMEIGLHHYQGDQYLVEPRVRFPGNDTDERPSGDEPILAELDLERHNELIDDEQYGVWLTNGLFASEKLKGFLDQARANWQDPDWKLRLRLYFGSTAVALHRLHWERLRDPRNPDAALAADATVILSRYLASSTLRTARLPPYGEVRTLVAIADPENIGEYRDSNGQRLARVRVQDEAARATDSLHGTQVSFLQVGSPAGRTTLNRLLDKLAEGYDILYLVCHGAITNAGPTIYLETESGQADSVDIGGSNGFVTRLSQLSALPRLVVLASCQSLADAGEFVSRDGGALATFGPRLVEIGVPAVVAMQGNITQTTVAEFMPRFFTELMEHGEIDRAMAEARRLVNVSRRPDWWMPVLFMRLASGRLWYQPGFDARQTGFANAWRDLCTAIKAEQVIPVLGPGLAEAIFGSPEEIAHKWAEIEQFPMALPGHTGLPELARYLATIYSRPFVPLEWDRHLRVQILRRYTEALQRQPEPVPLEQLITEMGCKCREREEDPYRVLSSLPAPIYVNAAPDNLLLDALRASNKDPQVFICPWNSDVEQPDSALTRNRGIYVPSVEQPLVYYPFGWLTQMESLVLSDDDYFQYLIWAGVDQTRGQNSDLLPRLNRALSQYAKMFLGFQLNDWTFRMLLYSITDPTSGRTNRWNSVAVQLGPTEGMVVQPEMTRSYLEKYFGRFRNSLLPTSLYWGTSQRFVQELWALHDQWKQEY